MKISSLTQCFCSPLIRFAVTWFLTRVLIGWLLNRLSCVIFILSSARVICLHRASFSAHALKWRHGCGLYCVMAVLMLRVSPLLSGIEFHIKYVSYYEKEFILNNSMLPYPLCWSSVRCFIFPPCFHTKSFLVFYLVHYNPLLWLIHGK